MLLFFVKNNSLQNNLKSIEIDFDEIISSEDGLVKWLELLHYTGISIVKNAPVEKNSAFKVLNRISHTRQTFFDTPFEVINIPKPNNSAYTAHALRHHMDLPWFENPPGYQFLHCFRLRITAIGSPIFIFRLVIQREIPWHCLWRTGRNSWPRG